MRELGIERVVLARENTLDDIRAIRAAVPELGLETFVHGALCISYSGQCFMSGMISERSANRGSCAQSCRKDYVLTDVDDRRGARPRLPHLGEGSRGARSPRRHRRRRHRLPQGRGAEEEARSTSPPSRTAIASFSTASRAGDRTRAVADGGRAARADLQPRLHAAACTAAARVATTSRATHPDNRGRRARRRRRPRGRRAHRRGDARRSHVGDGLGFEPPAERGGAADRLRGRPRCARCRRGTASSGRRSHAARLRVRRRLARGAHLGSRAARARARELRRAAAPSSRSAKTRLDVRLFGSAGAPLKAVFIADGETVTVRSEITLAPASKRALDARVAARAARPARRDAVRARRRSTLGGSRAGLFLPVSELNHLRQQAVDELLQRRDWARAGDARRASRPRSTRRCRARRSCARLAGAARRARAAFDLVAEVFTLDDARTAAAAGATEIVLDPFLRHPTPPVDARARARRGAARARASTLRLRTPTIVRPEERRTLEKWLDLGLPILSGHLGLVAELSRAGRDVIGGLRGELLQPAHRGGALPARRASHRALGGADHRRAARRRGAVGGRRLRRARSTAGPKG